MSEVDISIITVGFKSCDYVRELFESLFGARGNLSIEYFVLDNASDDGLINMVEKEFVPRADDRLKIFPIQNEKNLGFAAANNIGIKHAQGRYVLLLNPDMRLFPDTLTNMVAWMDKNTRAGIAGCKLLTQDRKIQPQVRRFPRISDQLAIILKLPHVWRGILNSYLVTNFDYEQVAHVDSIRGSFFMIRRNVIEKIGGLDERYFIWFEEVDYCKMAAAAGFEIWYTPAATCTDFVGRSFSLVNGYQKQIYFSDSMKKYFAKWHSELAAFVIRIAWAPVLFVTKLFS
jgi:GT2 family glycosyltransferase